MANKNKKVVVFQSENASLTIIDSLRKSFCGVADIRTASRDEMRRPDTLGRDTLAFVLPGIIGEESRYHQDIGPEGNRAIKEYVENGGVFLGVCAGAYYAASRILYDPPWLDTPKQRKPGLDFFNGLAKGPIKNKGINSFENWYSDCTVVTISATTQHSRNTALGVVYGNGPALYPDQPDPKLHIIARYANEREQPIAIGAKEVKNGLAIFSGVIPYIGYQALDPDTSPAEHYLLMEKIRPHEPKRKMLWNELTNRIIEQNRKTGRLQP